MDNLYDISDDDPKLPVDDTGMIEDGCHPSGMDDSCLRDLDISYELKMIQRRR